MANTLASTAENQNESVNVNVTAPINPADMIVHVRPFVISLSGATILRASMVMVQKRNMIEKALEKTEIMLTMTATLVVLPSAMSDNNRATIPNVGAPGGCPTWSLYAVAMCSPGSHQLTVGSTVRIWVTAAIAKTNHPTML